MKRRKTASAARSRGGRSGAALWPLWLLVLLPPLVFSPTASENFRLPKQVLSECLALASLVPLAWRWWGRGVPPLGRLARHPAVAAVAPLLAVTSLGLWTSDHPRQVTVALVSLWVGALCLVGWSLALDAAERWRLLRGLALPATLLAAFGILQFHGLFIPFEFEGELRERIKMTSLAGGAFDLAAYLVLPALVAQICLWRTRGRWRIAWAAALLLMLYAIAATQTLTAIAALVAATLAVWGVLLPRRRFLRLAAAAVAIVAVLGVAVAPLRERVVQKVGSFAEGDVDRFLTGRLDGWKAAVHMLAEHPITGVGHGAYRAEFSPAKLALLEAGASFYRGHEQTFFANAHSEPLEAAAEWGLPGLAALVWALFLLLRRLRETLAREVEEPPAALQLGGAVALAVLALTGFPLRLALVAYPYLLLLSATFAVEDEARPGRRGGRLPALALVLALALSTLWVGGRGWRQWQASRILATVEGASMAALASGRMAEPLMRRNLELLRKAEEMSPADVGLPLARGSQFFLTRRPRPAARAYREALELEPRAEIYLNLGRAQLQSGEREAAEEALRKAVRLDPKLEPLRKAALERGG